MKACQGRRSLISLLLALSMTPAAADELGERRLTWGGFGTVGVAWQGTEGIEYRRGVHQANGVEADEIEFGVDSVAGIQLNAAWSRRLEAVAQVTSRLDADNSWRPRLTRAFLRYAPDEDIMLRVGRLGWELLPRADSLQIGYSYLTIRPPVEVFGLLPNDNVDGLDLLLSRPVGPGIGRLKFYAGRSGGEIANSDRPDTNLSGSELWGGQVEYLVGNLEVRVGHGIYMLEDRPSFDPLVAALQQAGTPEGIRLADELSRPGRKVAFTFLGAAYDAGPLEVKLALANAQRESLPGPEVNFGHLTVGYSLGKVTPFAAFAAIDSYADVRPTGLPDTPEFAPLNAAAEAVQRAQQHQQQTYSLGLRYDFAPRMDIKLQVDRVFTDGTELVIDRRSSPGRPGNLTVIGLALDFIF